MSPYRRPVTDFDGWAENIQGKFEEIYPTYEWQVTCDVEDFTADDIEISEAFGKISINVNPRVVVKGINAKLRFLVRELLKELEGE